MATISFSDEIFASITLRGNLLARVRLNGVGSYSEILASLLKAAGRVHGLATVDVRNSSQGWSARRSVMLAG